MADPRIDLDALPLVLHGVTNEDYHSSPGISHSGAKRMRKSPYHYHALLDPNAPRKAPTPQMFNGTLTHCATLEPDWFDARYVLAPLNEKGEALNKNTNTWKEFAAGLKQTGQECITQQQRDLAFAQAAALRALPEVKQLLDTGHPEVSAWWRDPATDIICKCRPDWVSPVGYGKGVVLLDVKTTTDASPDQFAKSVANFEYHAQAEWYCSGYALASGLEVHGMVFAVVESEFPFAGAVFMLDDEAMRRAREMNQQARTLFAECERMQYWPGYPTTMQVISLPHWA